MKGAKTGGRKKGTLNKTTAEVRAFCSSLVGDKQYRAKLRADFKCRKLNPVIESMVWHYAVGKPSDKVEMTGADGKPLNLRGLTDAELAIMEAMAAKCQAP